MNETRILLLGAATTLGWISACNYTVGECWPVGQGGGSGSEAIAAAGGGVILPTGPSGAGGFGDEPPEPPEGDTNSGLKCNSDEDEEEVEEFGKPANQYIDCRKRGLSAAACSEVCSEAGAYCPSGAPHPYKSEPWGQLVWCKNGSPTYVCAFNFPNGDGCAVTRTFLGDYWLCSYPGGK
jgi:hypothetical protein